MTEYELITPSDTYTFEAEDFETAALVCFIMGYGYYGAEPKDGGEEVPIFIFGGAESWYKATFGTTFEEAIDDQEKVARLSRALASMMLGDFEDRAKYNAALEAIDDPEKKAAFIDEWQAGCSSLNNIGGRAHKLAEALAPHRQHKGGRTMTVNPENITFFGKPEIIHALEDLATDRRSFFHEPPDEFDEQFRQDEKALLAAAAALEAIDFETISITINGPGDYTVELALREVLDYFSKYDFPEDGDAGEEGAE